MATPDRSSFFELFRGMLRDDRANIEFPNSDDLGSTLKSAFSPDIMQRVENALGKGSDISNPEYQLIWDTTALLIDFENLLRSILDIIRKHNPRECELDLIVDDLDLVLSISNASSTANDKRFSEIINACVHAFDAKKKILDFVESRMPYIAPTLSGILGSAVAAKLMVIAGGLSALSKMPASNVKLLGAKKKKLAGFPTAGYIEQSEIFQTTLPALRARVCHLLASKATLAARIDSAGGDPSGNALRTLKDDIHKKIKKWQENPPAKQPQPLPIPDSEPREAGVLLLD